MQKYFFRISLCAIFTIALSFFSCSQKQEERGEYVKKVINEDSVLRVGMISRSGSYFTLRDNREMGFEYELAKHLATELGKELEVKVAKDMSGLVSLLDSGVPLIAFPLTISEANKRSVDFANYEFITHQVIVQKKNKGTQVRDVLDLLGKKITVVRGSKYHHRLLNLNDEIGGGIEINAVSTEYDEDKLIKMVSTGEIEMTVADNDVANLSRRYYKNIDITLEVSHPQRGAWAVAKGDTEMLGIVNGFFASNDDFLKKTRKKYFEHNDNNSAPQRKTPPYIDDHTICAWDSLFKKHAEGTSWDWRLLAAIAYHESRFNPDAGSFAGAKGLMQLLPETMLRLGGDKKTMLTPDENIRLAVIYMNRMKDLIVSARTKDDKIRLVLASYNAGLGHIRDAQRLCEVHGQNPAAWTDVERYIRMLSSPDYYNLPDVKHGYLRGDETADYVNDIMQLYSLYKRKFR